MDRAALIAALADGLLAPAGVLSSTPADCRSIEADAKDAARSGEEADRPPPPTPAVH